MNVSEQQLGKRPISIVVVAGYLLAFGIFRLVWQVPLVVHGHIPGMVSLTVFYLISGIVLLKRTWWARRVALATLVISTLDFAISAGHLAIGGVRLYAKGLLVA